LPSLRGVLPQPPLQESEWSFEKKKENPIETLKNNPIALILLGIVIGVLMTNMRPIIVNGTKL
jgi:hypothetical protein